VIDHYRRRRLQSHPFASNFAEGFFASLEPSLKHRQTVEITATPADFVHQH
jgi:hypothetical protein